MYMKTSVINLKVEPSLKAAAQERARKLGVPLSYVLHMQLLNFTRGEKVELPAEQMTPQLEKLIAEAEAEIAQGKVSGPFETAEDLVNHLKSL